MKCHQHIIMLQHTCTHVHIHSHTTSDWHTHSAQYTHIRIYTNAQTMHTKQTCTRAHALIYYIILKQYTLIHTSLHLHLSCSFSCHLSNLDNPWELEVVMWIMWTQGWPVQALHSVWLSTASVYSHTCILFNYPPPPSMQTFHISLFLHPPPLHQGPPSPSGGVLQLHWLQYLHHKWGPVVWLVQCGEQVLQETTVCQQQQFWWSEVGPDNRQVSHSGHCISCEHFRRRDSLPKRDQQHCKLRMTLLLYSCELDKCGFVPIHIRLYHCLLWLKDGTINIGLIGC